MPTDQAQDFLFQRIGEMLPAHVTMVDAISDILNVSSDSAYRRIRGETPLVLGEVRRLCNHFNLSLDQLLEVKTSSVLFQNVRVNNKEYNYHLYLQDLLKMSENINSFMQKEIFYLSKDLPIFHNFYYRPLIAFRYFFWMKTHLMHPGFTKKQFDQEGLPPEIEKMSQDLVRSYNRIPSTEMWNTESINSTISQIEFAKDSGHFNSTKDVRDVYEALRQTIYHMKEQAENGCKYMPDENPQTKKSNFKMFFNRVVLGDNTILIITDRLKTTIINYGHLNYIETRDEEFCNACYDDMQNLQKRSTMISQSSEKQRNIFFGILLSKVEERMKRI